MDDNFRRQLEENGADVEMTLDRFMRNEDMYLRFLARFLEDQNYGNLEQNLKAGQYEEAYKYAHTLRGLSANLGLDPIQKAVYELLEELRGRKNEEVDAARVNGTWQKIQETYARFVDVISRHQ